MDKMKNLKARVMLLKRIPVCYIDKTHLPAVLKGMNKKECDDVYEVLLAMNDYDKALIVREHILETYQEKKLNDEQIMIESQELNRVVNQKHPMGNIINN